MTDNTNQDLASNSPSFNGHAVRKTKSGKRIWTKIGATWAHTKGGGHTLYLDCIPLSGQIVLLPPDQQPE